jgi:putative FmdB family regulatory protein
MPTYEFRCEACDERFELVCGIAELETKAVCPACGAREVRQVFGRVATPGLGTRFNPGHFERPPARGAKPHYVPPKD